MTVVDGQNCLEDIIFRDDVPPVGGGMVAGGYKSMGICLEQGAQTAEEIRPVVADAEKLEAFQTCLEKTHEWRPCFVMIIHGLVIAFKNGGFCERIIRMLQAKLMPISMSENEHQVAFEQLETREQ